MLFNRILASGFLSRKFASKKKNNEAIFFSFLHSVQWYFSHRFMMKFFANVRNWAYSTTRSTDEHFKWGNSCVQNDKFYGRYYLLYIQQILWFDNLRFCRVVDVAIVVDFTYAFLQRSFSENEDNTRFHHSTQ